MKSTKYQIMAGAVIVFAICALYLLFSINGLAYQFTTNSEPQANITVIPDPALPTLDFSLLSSTLPTYTPDTDKLETGGFEHGMFVQIFGTGGSGLNVRYEAGTNSKAMFLAADAEVFEIIGGPLDVDGYIWWQLSAPYDQSRQGWAAENYLHLIEP